ncbi:hypothetical protein LZ30DRAFT_434065 [Colletotrichum cereale]|nr:hypothetical protein LZ30DRAFT_434065 [Colletotrichum cereale]
MGVYLRILWKEACTSLWVALGCRNASLHMTSARRADCKESYDPYPRTTQLRGTGPARASFAFEYDYGTTKALSRLVAERPPWTASPQPLKQGNQPTRRQDCLRYDIDYGSECQINGFDVFLKTYLCSTVPGTGFSAIPLIARQVQPDNQK